MSKTSYDILILGASYGSLLATKLAMGGHNTTMVCLPHEVEAFNTNGAVVRIPVRGRKDLVEVRSTKLKGKITAAGPADVDPAKFDLICLGMQEPQYRSPGVRELMEKIAKSGKPCMSIMNMPPKTYLSRIPGLDVSKLRDAYTDPTVWDMLDPKLMTLCSPDPQAFRPPEEDVNVLQVSLPTNFKAARFESDADTAILEKLEADVAAARFDPGDGSGPLELPVKLKVHSSIYVPLAKWAMLLTGNYRCIMADDMRAIRDAVHSDVAKSKAIYDWVKALCVKIGADEADLVPFEKYAAAAQGLAKPSSAARALAAGAVNIERVDKLVQGIAHQYGLAHPEIDATVKLVDGWLEKNRKKAAG